MACLNGFGKGVTEPVQTGGADTKERPEKGIFPLKKLGIPDFLGKIAFGGRGCISSTQPHNLNSAEI